MTSYGPRKSKARDAADDMNTLERLHARSRDMELLIKLRRQLASLIMGE
jgi:hypothetical protein